MLTIALVIDPRAFLELSVLMMGWGPIAGVGYFVVTWKEISYYHRLYETA